MVPSWLVSNNENRIGMFSSLIPILKSLHALANSLWLRAPDWSSSIILKILWRPIIPLHPLDLNLSLNSFNRLWGESWRWVASANAYLLFSWRYGSCCNIFFDSILSWSYSELYSLFWEKRRANSLKSRYPSPDTSYFLNTSWSAYTINRYR